jgi:hypothetical protein
MLHVVILRDIFSVIEVYELIVLHSPEGCEDGRGKQHADDKTAACVGVCGCHPEYPSSMSVLHKVIFDVSVEPISKPQITFEGKARVGEEAEHTW